MYSSVLQKQRNWPCCSNTFGGDCICHIAITGFL
uniref:Uncharacterized protein n=1 Tax=Anguilla anguilla TaxID=7936 RepID=A0A0E9Q3H5_ANGAN